MDLMGIEAIHREAKEPYETLVALILSARTRDAGHLRDDKAVAAAWANSQAHP